MRGSPGRIARRSFETKPPRERSGHARPSVASSRKHRGAPTHASGPIMRGVRPCDGFHRMRRPIMREHTTLDHLPLSNAPRADAHDAKRGRCGIETRSAPVGTIVNARRRLVLVRHGVLHAIMLLGTLRVVEAVERAHQVTRDAANALEGLAVLAPHEKTHHARTHNPRSPPPLERAPSRRP